VDERETQARERSGLELPHHRRGGAERGALGLLDEGIDDVRLMAGGDLVANGAVDAVAA